MKRRCRKISLGAPAWVLTGSFGAVFRLETLNDELPPKLFCDEEIWLSQTKRLLESGSFVINEFRSGSMSVYPVLLIAKTLRLVFGVAFSDSQLVILGRSALLIPGLIIATFFLDKTLRLLEVSLLIRVISLGAFVISPSVMALGRYWYPDHFIIGPASALLFLLVRLATNRTAAPSAFAVIGFSLGVAVATKYTAILLLVATLVAVGSNVPVKTVKSPLSISQTRRLVSSVVLLCISAISSFAILNFSLFVHFEKFISDVLINRDNYSDSALDQSQSFLFYSWMTLVAPFGLLGLVLIVAGLIRLGKSSLVLAGLFVVSPLALILLFGQSSRTINRNVALVLPSLVPAFAFGIKAVIEFGSSRFRKRYAVGFIVIALGYITAETSVAIYNDFGVDSRTVATEWVKTHIPKSAIIGINPGCNGLSVPELAGRSVVSDPDMKQLLSYYVFESYWNSAISQVYVRRWEQRYFHFYQYEQAAWPPALFPFDADAKVNLPGYQVWGRFRGEGGEVVIVVKEELLPMKMRD